MDPAASLGSPNCTERSGRPLGGVRYAPGRPGRQQWSAVPKAEQAQGMEGIGILFCSQLFGAGALMVVLHNLFE
jgi:hypothetical protein